MGLWRILLLLLPFGLPIAPARGEEPDAKGLEFFEKNVRPVLVERCYQCHSSQAKKLRGGLLLDTRAGWTKGGDSGPAIVPGDPEDSLLVRAVRYDDPAVQMPPKGKLPDDQIAVLVDWVKKGAPDPRTGAAVPTAQKTIDIEAGRRYWAFQPLQRVAPPDVHDADWCRTPIDRFILAKLEAKGLTPTEAVGRRQLIRRAYFDLIGLPPTPEEVESFVNDPATDAYDRLLDRLLASPHYGERWGRHWLDLARFAESHGFEHDYDRPSAYHYRDFVIRALNDDVPYDTFVKWQLAGDELAPADNLALTATGFLAAGVHSTQITANQVEKERYDELDDMANTMGTALLGLTIGCARCHDHKFDPIPQRDYYRLLSTFTTTVRSEIDLNLDPSGYATAKAAFEEQHAPYLAALAGYEAEQLPQRLERWEQGRGRAQDGPTWVVLDPVSSRSEGGATFARQDDGSLLVSGKNADHDTYTFVARADLKGITAVRLEALADPSLAKGGPGRAGNGNFALTDFRVTASAKGSPGTVLPMKLQSPRATYEQQGLPIRAAIDDDRGSGWAVGPQLGKDQAASFEVSTAVGFEGETVLTFTLEFRNNTGHSIGRPRLSVTTANRPVALDADGIPQRIIAILNKPRAERTVEQATAVLAWYRTIDPEWRSLNNAAQEHARQAPKPSLAKALISTEGLPAVRLHTQGADFLEKTHFLRRGDPNQKQGEAAQGFLQVLTTAPDQERHWRVEPPEGGRTSFRRASLASWITDADQGAGHLLARVIVNRLWQHHLGRGIVATPSDFGVQGERPTHPELLDWLAAELIRGGWRLKPMHKLMMTSAVYLEGSQPDSSHAALDGGDTLYGRRPRRRLEAEVIRDAMLAVSGRLDDHMFGPGSLDEAMTRRSIYFTVKRSKLVPMMMLFDSPDALQAIGSRSTTTVAPQSLLLMNSPIVRDWAVGFARRIAPKPGGSLEDAVRSAYLIALGRPPGADEQGDALAFVSRQVEAYKAGGKTEAIEPALTDFCQVLMGLNEFVYVE